MGMSKTACVDLFCGAGGLTHGLRSAGVNVVAGFDVDEACRHPFEENNAAVFIKEDIGRTSTRRLRELFRGAEYRILAGCAPCQPFSTYAQRYDVVGSPRWSLTVAPYDDKGGGCAKYGWHAEGDGTSFTFCTATQGYGAIEDKNGDVRVQCNLKR
jgi:site-specific DNA-cytosine methylase